MEHRCFEMSRNSPATGLGLEEEVVSATLGLVACWLVSSLQSFSGLSDLVGDLFPVVFGISVSWWSVEDMFPDDLIE